MISGYPVGETLLRWSPRGRVVPLVKVETSGNRSVSLFEPRNIQVTGPLVVSPGPFLMVMFVGHSGVEGAVNTDMVILAIRNRNI